jgi:hypothetical protein
VNLLTLQTLMSLLAGVRNRDLAVIGVVVVVLILLLVMASRRRRGPKLEVRKLDSVESQRYVDEFAAIERDFVDHPDQAAARAKGMVEEVMRRMGFPDRIDAQQRIRDLAGHDRNAAASLTAADKDLRDGAGDTERLRRVLQSYRDVLHRLLDLPRAA